MIYYYCRGIVMIWREFCLVIVSALLGLHLIDAASLHHHHTVGSHLVSQPSTGCPGPRIFQPRQPWLGAHSCLRGHIWLVTIRTSFSNQADVAIMCFWIKCAPWNMDDKYKCFIFCHGSQLTKSVLDYALLSRVQLCRDYVLFGGALWARICWLGAHKHFWGPGVPILKAHWPSHRWELVWIKRRLGSGSSYESSKLDRS